MPRWLVVVLVLAVIWLIFSSMPAGRRLTRRLGLPGLQRGRAPRKDREYLLRVCNGDREQVGRLLAHARGRNPEMTEAEAYRRAIRSYLRDR